MRTYTVQADVNVEVHAENAADARATFEAHIRALDQLAGIEIAEEGVYTWSSFALAERNDLPAAPIAVRGASAP